MNTSVNRVVNMLAALAASVFELGKTGKVCDSLDERLFYLWREYEETRVFNAMLCLFTPTCCCEILLVHFKKRAPRTFVLN